MNITFTFEDVSDNQVENVIDVYLKTRAYFGERSLLVKQGENNIRKQVKDFAEKLDSNFDDIILSDRDMSEKRRMMYTLLWDSINQLREMGEQN